MSNIITPPPLGQHICFVGTTGSGKSFLAKRMLETYDRVFIFDTHDAFDIPGTVKITSPVGLQRKLAGFDKIRYVPTLDKRGKEWYNYVIKLLMTSKHGRNRVIYIDEIFHLGFGMSFPDWLSKGISTARQRKTSVWVSSQRPTNIPMAIMTESRLIYVFYLSYEEDIKKVSKFARDSKNLEEVIRETKYDYSFIEIDRIKGIWKRYPKIKGGL